jgi:hypothetical protein
MALPSLGIAARRNTVFRVENRKKLLLKDCRGPFVENAGPHDHSGSNLETNREFSGPALFLLRPNLQSVPLTGS